MIGHMTTTVTVERTADGGYLARNDRGTEIRMTGTGGPEFSPVELLLAALGGCNIVTVEPLTAQRGHRLPRLAAHVTAEKKERPSRLVSITMTYDVELPAGDEKARPVFESVAERVHERYCTVSAALRDTVPVTVTT
jgi:putative redox protein